ncbi:unnamed protein product [Spirodela intermedia]|uniref:Uncharacterized protein n=1 Tax=Spirodela intermedia TaxID=51605 RepID=A0A7I8JZN2_SPIIN|nr:unnamed protein product [Spirodela intermedia]
MEDSQHSIFFSYLDFSFISVHIRKLIPGAALPLQRVDHVHRRHGLPASVLRVGDCIADHVLQEDLEDASRLLVDKAANALNASSPRQPPDRRLGDPLDIVPQHLAMALRAALAQPLPSLTPPRHPPPSSPSRKRSPTETLAEETNEQHHR